MTNAMSYNDAAEELRNILADLDAGKLNVDELADDIKRAKELIDICRSKISEAKTSVQVLTGADVN